MKRRRQAGPPRQLPTFRGLLLAHGACRCMLRTWGACWTCWAFMDLQREIAARRAASEVAT